MKSRAPKAWLTVVGGAWFAAALAARADDLEPRTIRPATRLAGTTIIVSAPKGFSDTLLKSLDAAFAKHGAKLRVAKNNVNLADALRGGQVLAIGHAWNNDAVRRLYYEYFDWTDPAWPSRGGYALRTIVDPYATGHDVIRIAYSNDQDAERAVRAFVDMLKRTPTDKGLAHLHVVKLGELAPVYAKYLDPLLSPNFKWQHEDNTWDLQVQISHLGLGYLLTGREAFLKAFRQRFLWYLKHNSARGWGGSHGFMHHITVPFFLTEHHPIWSREDRRTALRLIREVFLSGDGIRFAGFVAGTRGPYPRDNHATRAALDNFIHVRYLDRYHKLPEAKEGLELTASLDDAGLAVRCKGDAIRLGLPPARRSAGPFIGPRKPSGAAVETLPTRLAAFQEIPAKRLPAGTPTALREIDGVFVVATDVGDVAAVDADGRERWVVQTKAAVRRIAPLRKGDGTLTLLGDDSGKVTAVALDGTVRWQRQLPFSETVYTLSWTRGRSMVRALVTGDLDADGRSEVFAASDSTTANAGGSTPALGRWDFGP